jgi:mannitol/fructose-specific phosphotransferase system IIA component (Ntr-type)
MPIDAKKMISPERVITIQATNKSDVLNEMVEVLATSKLVTNKEELREKIFEREAAVSTGVGKGMAIPHVKIPSIKDFVAAIGICKGGIDFESLDQQPTYIIVMIGCNSSQSADFLKILARLVTHLRDEKLQKSILEADSSQAICDIFLQPKGIFSA